MTNFSRNQTVAVVDRKGEVIYTGKVAHTYADNATVGVLRDGRRFANVVPAGYVIRAA